MNVLVTGGAGFIGSHLTERLIREGYTVTILDNLTSGKLSYIDHLKEGIDFYKGDIRKTSDVEYAIKGKDLVFHLAAKASHRKSLEVPTSYFDVNLNGTLNILEAVNKFGCKIVYASSNSVYGRQKKLPISEDAPLRPYGTYAISKRACEDLVRFYKDVYGVQAVITRFNNVYGDWRTRSDTIFPELAMKVLNGDTAPETHDLSGRTRDFTWVGDIVDGLMLASTYNSEPIIFNLGTGVETPVADVPRYIGKYMNSDPPRIESTLPHETIRVCADISRAKKLLGYNPKVSFKEGVKRFVESFVGHYSDEA